MGQQDAETRGAQTWDSGYGAVGCKDWGWVIGTTEVQGYGCGIREVGTPGTGLCQGAVGDRIPSPGRGVPVAPLGFEPPFSYGTEVLGTP